MTFADKSDLGERAWFVEKAKSGGGALIDIGVHALDLAFWLSGSFEPHSVTGSVYRHFGHGDVDDQAVALVKLRNGSAIHLDVSWEVLREMRVGSKCSVPRVERAVIRSLSTARLAASPRLRIR